MGLCLEGVFFVNHDEGIAAERISKRINNPSAPRVLDCKVLSLSIVQSIAH
jgi:hypothetical protein